MIFVFAISAASSLRFDVRILYFVELLSGLKNCSCHLWLRIVYVKFAPELRRLKCSSISAAFATANRVAKKISSCNAAIVFGLDLDKLRTETLRFKCSSISAALACEFKSVFYRVAMQLIFGLHLDKLRTETLRFKSSSISAAFELANFSPRILSSCNAANIWIASRQTSH